MTPQEMPPQHGEGSEEPKEQRVEKETTTLERGDIKAITDLIGAYLILQSEQCARNNWTEPGAMKRFEEINVLYNKLSGAEGEHFVVTNIREQIETNRNREK